tara:strand:- start:73 stop:939 length:867 start_codon:yes stop_codon:yes gene_type:complete
MSKPGKVLKGLCKKLGVRLTVKRGKKRVYKSVKVLKRQCDNKKKKKRKVKRKRRKFGTRSRSNSLLSELMEQESVGEELYPYYQVYDGEGSRQESSPYMTPRTNTKKRKAKQDLDGGKRRNITKDFEVKDLDLDTLTQMFQKENKTRNIMESLNQEKLIIKRKYENIKTEYESVLDREDKAVEKHSEEYNKLFHYLDGFYKKKDDDMTYEFKYINNDNLIVLGFYNSTTSVPFKDFCNNYKKIRNRTSFGRKSKVKRKKVKRKSKKVKRKRKKVKRKRKVKRKKVKRK